MQAKQRPRTPKRPTTGFPEFENERVRVVRIRYGPHEKSIMHSHPELVTVYLTDCRVRFKYPDGETEDIQARAGDILPYEATEHLPENVGETSFEAIADELKCHPDARNHLSSPMLSTGAAVPTFEHLDFPSLPDRVRSAYGRGRTEKSLFLALGFGARPG